MRKTHPKARGAGQAQPKSAIDSSGSTEKALLDATQRLQSILIANEVATWTWDVVNDRVIADQNLARLFGVPRNAEASIETYLEAIHPDDRLRVTAAINAALAGPEDRYAVDYRVVRKDGSYSWLSARGRVERDESGKPQYFPGVVIDITARRATEQSAEVLRFRLEQQSHLFDITLSSIKDFAYIFDQKGRFTFVNQALLDLWGLRLEDAVGKNFYDLHYPDELAGRLQRQIQQVFDSQTELTDEAAYTSPTGAGGYYEYIFRPVFGRDGMVEAVAGSTRDITQRKRVEEELRQSQERLRVLAETLENQVAARTAELEERNNQVLRQSEALRDLSVSLMETRDRESRRIARELHDSAGQMIATLSMNLGRMIAELKRSNPDLVKLAEETQNGVNELSREIRTTSYLLHPPMLDEVGLRAALSWYAEGLQQRAGLAVELNIPKGFERPSREIEITIFRIVQEGLINIHRHSGSKSAHITLAREGGDLTLEIRDAGRGIPPDKLSELQTKGGGVGLRGVRERVRQFEGDLRINSREGFGTTILVRLPVPDKVADTPAADPQLPAGF
jgi:PAS domain S-box-containing protein